MRGLTESNGQYVFLRWYCGWDIEISPRYSLKFSYRHNALFLCSSSERRDHYATKMARMLLSSKCEEQRSVVLFLWARGHNPSEIHRDMCGMYGENCMDRSNVSRRCAFFKDGRDNLCGSPLFGRPVTALTPRNITASEGAIFNDQRIQLQTLSQFFNISKGAMYDIVHETLKFLKFSACWLPKNLTDHHKGQ